jgi:hypothetical protein
MQNENPRSLLISGESGSGKSASLMNIRNQEQTLYLNCDAGKPLPFKNQFTRVNIDDPYEVHSIIQKATEDPKKRFSTIVIDTASFLMDKFESIHVIGSTNTMNGWAQYAQYFKILMNEHVAKFHGHVIFLAHLHVYIDEDSGEKRMTVPVKGSLSKNGLEAYFTTVINARKVKISELDKYNGNLLNITGRDRAVGYKHVFQTLTTKQTVGDRIRSPMGLFSDDNTYIDNDVQLVIDHLTKFYQD